VLERHRQDGEQKPNRRQAQEGAQTKKKKIQKKREKREEGDET